MHRRTHPIPLSRKRPVRCGAETVSVLSDLALRLSSTMATDSSRITVNYFCLGALLIFVGSVLLCALGFTIVLPYEATRSWPEVMCSVVNSTYDVNVCSCDEHVSVFDKCVSKYPCLQVHVSYLQVGAPSGAIWQTTTISADDETTTGVNDGHQQPSNTEGRQSRSAVSSHRYPVMYGTPNDLDEGLKTPKFNATEQVTRSEREYRRTAMMTTTTDLDLTTGEQLDVRQDEDNFIDVRQNSTLLQTSGTGDDGSLEVQHQTNVSRTMSRSRTKRTVNDGRSDDEQSHGQLNVTTKIAQLYRSWDDSFHPKCSLTECGDDQWNVKESRDFKSRWGRIGQDPFPCFYNPARHEMVILDRTSPEAAIHAVVWPCLFLATGIALWLGLCLGCWSVSADAVYKDEYSGVVIR